MYRLWEEALHGWIREIMTLFWMRLTLWQPSRSVRAFTSPVSRKLPIAEALSIRNSFLSLQNR